MQAAPAEVPEALGARFPSFDPVVELIRTMRDVKLLVEVETGLRLARYTPGRIEFEPAPSAPAELAARLAGRLQGWTHQRWGVSVVSSGGAPTIAEARDAHLTEQRAKLQAENPLVQAFFAAFPEAKFTEIRAHEVLAQAAAESALPEVEDEWDPFEDG
jgi:DNA polymerase-3 subunit gamma/tau